MIRFQPGDEIRVSARGCAQAGGSSSGVGSTWRRYASREGDSAELYYYALINIPGATPGFYKIVSATNTPVHYIPANVTRYLRPDDLILRLGYEDFDYTDNGYWGRPGDPTSGDGRDGDGQGGQCKGVANAEVQIFIRHNMSPPPLGVRLPYDLVWERVDDNGLPLNPESGRPTSRAASAR